MTSFAAKILETGDGTTKRVPLSIGHRGYPSQYVENTIKGLTAAVELGADGIETDVHLSKDGEVVISHDPTGKRVFGSDGLIKERTYKHDLEHLTSIKEPYGNMPLLKDLLKLFVENPNFAGKWLIIDVKADNEIKIIEAMARVLDEVQNDRQFWKTKIIFGIWLLKFLPECHTYIPELPLMHIGINISYAQKFLNTPNLVAMSILLPSLYSRSGYDLIREVKKLGKAVCVWTVNSKESMAMCIALQIDAVLTDNAVEFTNLCQSKTAPGRENTYDFEKAAEKAITWSTRAKLYVVGYFVNAISPLLIRRYE
ncbi:PLC-like phosphodiesterase [Lipomyces japonicus]|uniref:PLC-like phosphodiesterase n=1 Tax=Lipomyces japonicus TaxID=56871 RepID=UPI0034CFBA31